MAGESSADPENARAVEVSAIVGGERSAQNERHLHEVIRARAAALRPPTFNSGSRELFQSFFIGGFECATHRGQNGRRLDLVTATRHDLNAAADYRMLADHGIRTVRDGLRWHLIERSPGQYDWSSFLPMIRAARETGTQVIWDICHWGWPDDLARVKPSS